MMHAAEAGTDYDVSMAGSRTGFFETPVARGPYTGDRERISVAINLDAQLT